MLFSWMISQFRGCRAPYINVDKSNYPGRTQSFGAAVER